MKGESFIPFEKFKGAGKKSEKMIMNYKEVLPEILRHGDGFLSSPFLQQHTGSVSVPYSAEVQEIENYSMTTPLYFA